jgi:hypothetical protein
MNLKKRVVSVSFIACLLVFSNASAFSNSWPLRATGEVHYLKFIKVYDVSLYSPETLSAETILQAHISKCLKLDYAIDLSLDKFRLVTDKILKRQQSSSHLESIKKPLEQLQNAYKPVKKGDFYRLCYEAKTQMLRLEHNDSKLVEIRSEQLASTYLGIWLSNNKPISRPLYNRFFHAKKTTVGSG